MNSILFYSNEQPIIGLVLSLVLFFGTYQLGSIIYRFSKIEKLFSNFSDPDYLKSASGIIFLILILNPILLFFPNSKVFLIFVSFSLLFLGLLNILKFSKNLIIYKELDGIKLGNFYKDKYLIIFYIISLLLISLSPNTDADSLDYHLRTAKFLAEYGKFPQNIFHFHERLSGPGEIIIAIGLICGTESFGSLVQASGLLVLYGIFKKISLKKEKENELYFLVLITAPVIFFLTSISKPQLFFICTSLIVFSMNFFVKEKQNLINLRIIISLIIIFISYQVKFSFILSSFCFFTVIFYKSIKDKYFKNFLLISFCLFIIIILPPMVWKYINFDFNILEQLVSPVPLNLSGMEFFYKYLTALGNNKTFYSYLIPDNILNYTNSLGFGILFIFLFKFYKNNETKIIFLILLFFVFISVIFGQRTERFFYEPLIWIIFSSIYFGIWFKTKYLNYIFRIQVYASIFIIIFSLATLTSGTITKNLREHVLINNANGYSLYKWANSKINKDDIIFTLHRSISYRFDKTVHFEFINFRGLNGHSRDKYISELKIRNPKYLLTYGNGEKPRVPKEIKDCVGNLIYFKKNVGRHASRNPFRKGNYYNGYLYEFRSDLLPKCIK